MLQHHHQADHVEAMKYIVMVNVIHRIFVAMVTQNVPMHAMKKIVPIHLVLHNLHHRDAPSTHVPMNRPAIVMLIFAMATANVMMALMSMAANHKTSHVQLTNSNVTTYCVFQTVKNAIKDAIVRTVRMSKIVMMVAQMTSSRVTMDNAFEANTNAMVEKIVLMAVMSRYKHATRVAADPENGDVTMVTVYFYQRTVTAVVIVEIFRTNGFVRQTNEMNRPLKISNAWNCELIQTTRRSKKAVR